MEAMLALGLPLSLVQARCDADDRFFQRALQPEVTFRREGGPADTIARGGQACTSIWEETKPALPYPDARFLGAVPRDPCDASFEDKHITVNGLRLHYIEWGASGEKTILILHDLVDDAHSWDTFSSYFAEKHRVIVLDLRGLGDSEWAKDGEYSFDAFVGDVAGVIGTLNLSPVAILGHSLGGIIGMRYAMSHSETVNHLITIDTPPSTPRLPIHQLRDTLESLRDDCGSLEEMVALHRPAPPLWNEEMLQQLVRRLTNDTPDGRVVMKLDYRGLLAADRQGKGPLSWDLWDSLDHLQCPTLILQVGRTPSLLQSRVAKKFHRRLPGSALVEMSHVSHMAHIEDPVTLAQLVEGFLDDTQSPR
jgi:pimeloyl-ACP methyl ester carboxylesterase